MLRGVTRGWCWRIDSIGQGRVRPAVRVFTYPTLSPIARDSQNKHSKRVSLFLRVNGGIYRESQMSSEKSNFGLYQPNNPLQWLFQKNDINNGTMHFLSLTTILKYEILIEDIEP